MKVLKGEVWVDGVPYVMQGGAWVKGEECWVLKDDAWVQGDCGPTDPKCTPLPAAADAFLEPPGGWGSPQHVRDGVILETVESTNPDGVFPDGPRPFIGGFGQSQSRQDVLDMGASGYTSVGSFYGTQTGTTLRNRIQYAVDAGMKIIVTLQDKTVPIEDGQGDGDSYLCNAGNGGAGSAAMNNLLAAYQEHIDLVKGNASYDDAVIGWGFTADDTLSVGTCYKACADYVFPWMIANDGRAITEVPNFEYKETHNVNPWLYQQDILEDQMYWIDSFRTTTRTYVSRISFFWRKRRLSETISVMQASDTGKPKSNVLLTYSLKPSQPDKGTEGYTTEQQAAWRDQSRTCEILHTGIAGCHGFSMFQHNPTWDNLPEINALVKKLVDGDIPNAILWGERKGRVFDSWTQGDMTRTPVDNWKFKMVLLEEPYVKPEHNNFYDKNAMLTGNNNIQQWDSCRIPERRDPQDNEIILQPLERWIAQVANPTNINNMVKLGGDEGKTRYTNGLDALAWMNVQYKGARYLFIVNLMPNQDVWEYYIGQGDLGGEPQPGVGDNADYTMTNRFNFPAMPEGVKVTELIHGVENPAEVNLATGEINVAIGAADSRVYKFEAADGYCGGDEPIEAPPVIGTLQAQSGVIGDDVTFTISASNAPTSYQWYEAGYLMPGETASSMTKTNVQLSQNGTLYKATASNDYGTSEDSNSVALTVTDAPVELVTNGDGSNGTVGWSAHLGTIANVGGKFVVTNVGTNYCGLRQEVSGVEAGKQYTLKYTLDKTANCEIGSSGWGTDILSKYKSTSTPVTVTETITATSNMLYMAFYVGNNNAGNTTTVYNISIQEV